MFTELAQASLTRSKAMDENLFDDVELDTEEQVNEEELNDGVVWRRAQFDE